jgi:predicted O-methyltransferase YrrM
MRTDPFSIRRLPKYHLARIWFTSYSRLLERVFAYRFDSFALPLKAPQDLPELEERENLGDTAVTPLQMQYLAAGLAATEQLEPTAIVEVGCYRGVTTQFLARRTKRTVFAIDPFFGYGGCDQDMSIFQIRIRNHPNVIPVRKTSGEAARSWNAGDASFIFIDAVHDYVNVAHDIEMWSAKLTAGGILALHDTDDQRFPGTRCAVFRAARSSGQFTVFGHTENLTMLRKNSPDA